MTSPTLADQVAAALAAATPYVPAATDAAPDHSQEALALLFSQLHEHDWRYVAGWGHWLRWTATHWVIDADLSVIDLSRALCRRVGSEVDKPNLARSIASDATISAVVRLARADRRHASIADQWDRDPWLLNTPGGTVDLRTGDIRPHRQADHLTKITAVAPAPMGAPCPVWENFLRTVCNGDQQLIDFLQRIAGYCATGSIREHALFFAEGPGGNGKSTFIGTLKAVLGDYAVTASMDTFTASRGDRHPTELAMLRGARLVTAQETEEGQPWAAARIKALTGGDPISARFMRQDFFTFTPTFKLFVAGNHKPSLRSVDQGIRRRFHLIPFHTVLRPEQVDPDLPEKLRAEWPAILAWLIEGTQLWLGEGLQPPEAVRNATDDYLTEEDAIGRWLEESCTRSPGAVSRFKALYASWISWAEANGEAVGSQRRLASELANRGYTRTLIGHEKAKGYAGIVIRGAPLERRSMDGVRTDADT